MAARTADEALMAAVARHDPRAVQDCLDRGADANYTRVFDDEEAAEQPTTPLRLVMFCISDSFLDDADLAQFAEVARLLLRHGADPTPAMQLAEARYGKYDPAAAASPFMDVWRVVAQAKRG